MFDELYMSQLHVLYKSQLLMQNRTQPLPALICQRLARLKQKPKTLSTKNHQAIKMSRTHSCYGNDAPVPSL